MFSRFGKIDRDDSTASRNAMEDLFGSRRESAFVGGHGKTAKHVSQIFVT